LGISINWISKKTVHSPPSKIVVLYERLLHSVECLFICLLATSSHEIKPPLSRVTVSTVFLSCVLISTNRVSRDREKKEIALDFEVSSFMFASKL